MTKMSKKKKKKIRHLENGKSFSDEIKSIFHHFKRAFVEASKKKFFEMSESGFNKQIDKKLTRVLPCFSSEETTGCQSVYTFRKTNSLVESQNNV